MNETTPAYRVATYSGDEPDRIVHGPTDAKSAGDEFHRLREAIIRGEGDDRTGVKLQVEDGDEWATVYHFMPGDAEFFRD